MHKHFNIKFCLNFGVHFRTSPLTYINKKRISTAKAMLKTDYYTISEISNMCGFLSLSYFSYAFRKSTGFSPTDYSKRFK
ncbi:MAG: helix-turn-helix transcriptional regulator [Clostridia bacterium]|nr:helix-turn-helix transcriptional regulator [Clostridia bacterium]